jgi:phosphate transport system substrate-binding protein
MKSKTSLAASMCITLSALAGTASARDHIDIVGSSTVYPFATVVAEQFGKSSKFPTPKIESTGSGGGMKLFCMGVGGKHPDITNASRRIKKSEYKKCQRNGVNEIIEIKIGYDGITLANSKKAKQLSLTRKDIFLALANEVPDPKNSGQLMLNPYKTWKDVNPSLPNIKIEVLGPPPTSGTRDAFAELAMEGGCKQFRWIKAMKKRDKRRYRSICHTVREDGAFIEAGENDNLIVKKLASNPDMLGIFGFSFLDQNKDVVQASKIDGKIPSFEAIADYSYAVSRPLYFYVKKAHIGKIPGIKEYIDEFMSDKASGDEGYLVDRGLIPMPSGERKQFVFDAKQLTPMEM